MGTRSRTERGGESGEAPQWSPAAASLPGGGILAFAAETGRRTVSGGGHHSPYTEELVRAMERGLPVMALLTAVGDAVVERTGGRQVPWYSGETDGAWRIARRQTQSREVIASSTPSSRGSEPTLQETFDTAAVGGERVRIGDAEYDVGSVPGAKGAFGPRVRLWPGGVVPYALDQSLSRDQRALFLEAAGALGERRAGPVRPPHERRALDRGPGRLRVVLLPMLRWVCPGRVQGAFG